MALIEIDDFPSEPNLHLWLGFSMAMYAIEPITRWYIDLARGIFVCMTRNGKRLQKPMERSSMFNGQIHSMGYVQ